MGTSFCMCQGSHQNEKNSFLKWNSKQENLTRIYTLSINTHSSIRYTYHSRTNGKLMDKLLENTDWRSIDISNSTCAQYIQVFRIETKSKSKIKKLWEKAQKEMFEGNENRTQGNE